MAAITAADILRACDLLRKWRDSARRNGKDDAVKEIEHVMRVVNGLYAEGK
ncbi:MAG TPA: hypothetical protein VFH17_08255 [Coriobacteriia bacterium]|nr:hypothetical protein [Coriobacteriia bacterium]